MQHQLPIELTPHRLIEIANSPDQLVVTDGLAQRLDAGHGVLKDALERGDQVYGVNTGFGPFVNRTVEATQLDELQFNLIHQLNAGAGAFIEKHQAKAVLLNRINTLSKGYSGVSSALLEALIELYNADVIPAIQKYGSVGASGDLVPLSSLARVLQGGGNVFDEQGAVVENSVELLHTKGLKPYKFQPKEALAMVNGTSYSEAMTSEALLLAEKWLFSMSLPFTAQVMGTLGDSVQHLSTKLYDVKAHQSAAIIAERLRTIMLVTEPEKSHGVPQPPYSSRSSVLWLGACYEELLQARQLLSIELNSTDDNPIFDPDSRQILHGANFQGTYTALAADAISSALVKMSKLAEAQVKRVLHESQNNQLPAYLADEPIGLNSGFQGIQLMITSLLARIKGRFRPQGVESISTNDHNQDVVSMSANAALQAHEILESMSWMAAALEIIGNRLNRFAPKSKIFKLHEFDEDVAMSSDYQKELVIRHEKWLRTRLV